MRIKTPFDQGHIKICISTLHCIARREEHTTALNDLSMSRSSMRSTALGKRTCHFKENKIHQLRILAQYPEAQQNNGNVYVHACETITCKSRGHLHLF